MPIAMDKRWTYDQVTVRLGQALSADALKLRLTMHNPYSDLPKPQPIKYRGVDTLQEVLTSFQKSTDQLFYEALDIPLLEQRTATKVCVVSITGDRGLCGAYNSAAIKKTEARINELKEQVNRRPVP